jgi:membrane protein DedA with SNARE-associated domain
MDALLHILDSYGYALLFALGFAEYAGVPIASVPILIASGALAHAGGLSLPLIVGSAALGGLTADALWYWLGRWTGCRLVAAACALSSNRKACVLGVEERVTRIGVPYILSAKFIPGAGNLIAPAAGFGRVPAYRFLALDGVGLLAWATAYAGVGWLFSERVGSVIDWAMVYARWVLWGLPVLLVGGAAWRYSKVRAHRGAHPNVTGNDAAGTAEPEHVEGERGTGRLAQADIHARTA